MASEHEMLTRGRRSAQSKVPGTALPQRLQGRHCEPGKGLGPWNQVCILDLPLTGCVSLGQLPNFSVHQFLHLLNGPSNTSIMVY